MGGRGAEAWHSLLCSDRHSPGTSIDSSTQALSHGIRPRTCMASVIQMLVAQEHRLVIPFSLKNLQSTLAGTCMPMPHGAGEDSLKRRAEPSLQAVADHLTALTRWRWRKRRRALLNGRDSVSYRVLALRTLRLHFPFSVLSTARINGASCYDRSCQSWQMRKVRTSVFLQ